MGFLPVFLFRIAYHSDILLKIYISVGWVDDGLLCVQEMISAKCPERLAAILAFGEQWIDRITIRGQ
ncbi:hypothetical protein NM75_21580 [Dickeya fangzhongdai]|nr:hypothetical protein LH89_04970 [Dickeya fangzhongdai]KGT96154.1 hypothetical protein NM75_21580 [Dickeya fangzhongdai]